MQTLLNAVQAGELKPQPKTNRSGRMFISHTQTSSGANSTLFAEALAERARTTTSVLETILHQTNSYRHWGINE